MSEKINPIDSFSAIQKMKNETGWKLFMERYAKEGDEILDKILDTDLSDNGVKYTKRDLYVHQLEALGRIGKVLKDFETDAKNERDSQKNPSHIGN